MLSCEVKLCEKFRCQNLLKSDNITIPQLIANNMSGCFFKHGVYAQTTQENTGRTKAH